MIVSGRKLRCSELGWRRAVVFNNCDAHRFRFYMLEQMNALICLFIVMYLASCFSYTLAKAWYVTRHGCSADWVILALNVLRLMSPAMAVQLIGGFSH